MSEWRDLPGWRVLGTHRRERPPAEAERSGDGYFASTYDEHGHIVQTWIRVESADETRDILARRRRVIDKEGE